MDEYDRSRLKVVILMDWIIIQYIFDYPTEDFQESVNTRRLDGHCMNKIYLYISFWGVCFPNLTLVLFVIHTKLIEALFLQITNNEISSSKSETH